MADKGKKFCVTTIPKSWPQLINPAWHPGMSVMEANKLWADHVRRIQRITPTPRLYRRGEV
jgi:hypothetical protein